MKEYLTRVRTIARASADSANHTERMLSLELLDAADQLERLRDRQREAAALIGKLSFELSATRKANALLMLHEGAMQ